MRKKSKYIVFILLFLTGLSILLYPYISNRWNECRAGRLMSSYRQSVEKTDIDKLEQIRKAVVAYNESLKGAQVPDAFSVRDGVKDKEYEALLNIGSNGIMGTVEIPKIHVNLPIYHYTAEETLKKGAGHLFGSSLPVGGQSTHAVISAHRGLPSAKLFTDLDLLKKNDCFYLHILDDVLAYQIDEVSVVKPNQTESLAIEGGKDYVTLITCTPYAVNTHRLLVGGHRIPYDKDSYSEQASKPAAPQGTSIIIRILCAAAGILIALIFVWIWNRRSKKGGHV